jgi:hypothetical protein
VVGPGDGAAAGAAQPFDDVGWPTPPARRKNPPLEPGRPNDSILIVNDYHVNSMTKDWICTQCSQLVTRSLLVELVSSEPERCEQCGNAEFDETVRGPVHPSVDSLRH